MTDPRLSELRVALVHDWLTGRRGGERVLEVLLGLFPRAEIFTLVHVPGAVPAVEERPIHASWLSRLPAAGRVFPLGFPLFHQAMGRLELSGFDLVLSVSHCAAKNVLPPAGVPHLCYCLTPARYAWDLFDEYLDRALGPVAPLARPFAARVRDRWREQDRRRAESLTAIAGISNYIRARIARCYGREAELIYPPVEVARFATAGRAATPGERFLAVAALRPNKRLELIAEVFAARGLPLDIVGPAAPAALTRLRRRFQDSSVTLHGEVEDERLVELVAGCRAFVHAADEDFGIAPVEAMAAGRPVIAYGDCGVGETVLDADSVADATGVLFERPDFEGLDAALDRFLVFESTLRPEACRARARLFDRPVFEDAMRAWVTAALAMTGTTTAAPLSEAR